MTYSRYLLSALLWTSLSCAVVASAQQPWSGVIAPARATSWTQAGLPGDVPPDGSWAQCGSTISAYGSSGSYASPTTIQNTINACGNDQYVLLGPGDFYLSSGVNLRSNVVLRGTGANQTRIHVSAAAGCNGQGAVVCIVGGVTYAGYCLPNNVNTWNCPQLGFTPGYPDSANWTGSYSQGATTITLDNVTGIVTNLTPIVLDQCDTGLSGSSGVENCNGGSGGVVTAASVYSGSGGSGYNVGDTGKINCVWDWGRCYGSGTATYSVTAVSGGAVTAFTVTNGGSGYTYTNVNTYFGAPTMTTATSGGGSAFEVQVTGISAYDNNGFFVCAISSICSITADSGSVRVGRSQEEVVLAESITGSGPYTVTLNHPLMHPNWTAGQSPQAWWGTSTITNSGVENVLIDVSAVSSSCVSINAAAYVWVKGIACNTANFFHVYAYVASNFLVRDSYFYWTKNAGTTSYGIGSGGQVGNSLFENNILQGIVDPLNVNGPCTGCVFAYNFSVNQYDGASNVMFASSPMHSAATDYILEEGNIGSAAYQDNTHGPHLADTFFRNYFTGYETNNGSSTNNATIPVTVGAFSRYNNYLGNVLGTAGYHTIYQCIPGSSSTRFCAVDAGSFPGYVHIWDLGFSAQAQSDFSNTPAEPNDLLTSTSLYRYGNYDVVNGSVQWNSSEVPTTDPNFPNPVPASNTFSASFYNGVTAAYLSCGTGLSFWMNPTTGTCPPYPSIGPDVRHGDIGLCTSGTYQWSRALTSNQCAGGSFNASVNGGYGNSNPAMRCYFNQMGGLPDGTGGMLSFNPASCYATDSAGTIVHPSAVNTLTGSYSIIL
jgi:hypothetical protein